MIKRRLVLALALVCAAGAVYDLAAPGPTRAKSATLSPAASAGQPGSGPTGAAVSRGRSLFADGCSSCHGLDARGLPGQGPSLHGAGAAAADFYLSTGRMPLDDPRDEPVRTKPAYNKPDIEALVAYVGSLGGPAKPVVNPRLGRLNEGFKAFRCPRLGGRDADSDRRGREDRALSHAGFHEAADQRRDPQLDRALRRVHEGSG